MALDHRADGGRTVVIGVDGSDSSWHAAAYAVGLARRQEALLVVVHVLPQHTSAMLGGVAWMLNGTDTSEADRLRRRVATGLVCSTEARSLRWEFHTVRGGDVVAGLTRVADALRADTVVLGASRRLRHRIFGSAGVRMVRVGRWPVVVVP